MIKSGNSNILRLLQNPIEETVPKGWYTVVQLAKVSGMSEAQMYSLVRKEKPPRRVFRVDTGNGFRPLNHYFFKI